MVQFFTSNVWLIWVIISILCLILELTSGDFFILCFAIGAAVGAIVAGCGLSLTWQIIMFAVVSALSLLLVRPALLKKLHKPHRERLSNADAMIGQEGRVSEPIIARERRACACGEIRQHHSHCRGRRLSARSLPYMHSGSIIVINHFKFLLI